MLDALGYRKLTSKAILSHTIGGLVAAIAAHWMFVLYALVFGTPTTFEGGADRYSTVSNTPVIIEFVSENQVRVGDRVFTDEAGDTPEEDGSLARVIEGMLLTNHETINVADGVKIDAAGFIAADKLPAETRESLMKEVQAGFDMYRNRISEKMYGCPLEELTPEQLVELDESIPFKFEQKDPLAVEEEFAADESPIVETPESVDVETSTDANVVTVAE